MRKIICILLIISSVLTLFACVYEYPAVQSTEEEKRTVLSIDTDIEDYDVPYEVYRAVFLTLKPSIDNGDDNVWTNPDTKDSVRELAHSAVKEKIAEIYAAFYLAKKNGIIDPYSDDVERKIDEYIKIGVEGGIIDGADIVGHGGDYDKYLAALKEINLNYNAHVLMYRYRIVMSEIYKYYLGESDEVLGENHLGSNLNFTKDDVKAFYNSDECVRLIPAYIEAKYSNSLDRATTVRDGILARKDQGETAVKNYINSQLLTDPYGMDCGLIIGRYSLERGVYRALTDSAFELSENGVSEIVEVKAEQVGYYVLYKAQKSESNFENYYSDILTVYLNNSVGELYDAAYNTVLSSLSDTDYIKGLDFSTIRMP